MTTRNPHGNATSLYGDHKFEATSSVTTRLTKKNINKMETQPSNTSSKKRIAKLLDRSKLPLYGAVEVSSDGNAILPHDFLPAHPEKLPEDWFYGTIGYWRYFDQTQRDKLGNVSAPPHLSLPTPDNVKKWQAKAISVFGSTH
jgi:hypothetical protein